MTEIAANRGNATPASDRFAMLRPCGIWIVGSDLLFVACRSSSARAAR